MNQKESLLWAIYSHELKLKELYQTFARKFTTQATFWSQMAQEEQEHAEQVTRVRRQIEAGERTFNPSALTIQAVEASMARIDTVITRCGQGQLDLVQALGHALDLEQGMLERGYHRCLSSPQEGSQSIGMIQQEQTQEHIASLRTKLAEVRHA